MTPEGSHVYSIFAARGKIGIMGKIVPPGAWRYNVEMVPPGA